MLCKGMLISRTGVWLAALLVAGAAGCDTLQTFQVAHSGKWMEQRWLDGGAEQAPVSVVLTSWDSHVYVTRDEANGKKRLPGLAGRLMLFSEGSTNLVEATGEVRVQVFDVTNLGPEDEPIFKAQWDLDPHALKKLRKEDRFTDGYTIFLPWDTFSPDIKQVLVQTYYYPKKGVPPIYSDPQTLTLQLDAPLTPRVQGRTTTKTYPVASK